MSVQPSSGKLLNYQPELCPLPWKIRSKAPQRTLQRQPQSSSQWPLLPSLGLTGWGVGVWESNTWVLPLQPPTEPSWDGPRWAQPPTASGKALEESTLLFAHQTGSFYLGCLCEEHTPSICTSFIRQLYLKKAGRRNKKKIKKKAILDTTEPYISKC